MRITHVSNSFLIVETASTKLVCDPWVGRANHGGWRSFPEFDRDELIARVRDADYVYISHLHSDHFDPGFLADAGLIGAPFLIKAFGNGALRNRLKALGVQTVIEAGALEPFEAGDMRLAVVPQFQTSNAGVETSLDYDLDTSLIVAAEGQVFFNQVDNPLADAHFQIVKEFCDRNFGPIDAAALVCGAAGEYPQCFLNIDRAAEQARIIDASLAKLERALRILEPRLTFLAGGSYVIPGRLTALSRFIAQPTAEAAARHCAFTPMVCLEGGKSLCLPGGAVIQDLTPVLAELGQVQAAHADEPYPYEDRALPSVDELEDLFGRAKPAFEAAVAAQGVRLNIDYEFHLYDGLTEERARQPSRFARLALSVRTDAETVEPTRLRLHMDARAFALCLTRAQSWNQTISGSLVLQERWPNRHQPDALFALNLLVVPKETVVA
jgi:UDP-MurNAc hydroxylase